MPTISLCMIVKDEESILERHLRHIKEYVDEIIIVDTGSKDKTKEIAKKFTNKVYDFKWCDDFSKAWNFSISKATKEWLLILAADEFIEKPEKLKKSISMSGGNILAFKQFTAHVDYERLDKDKNEILNALKNSQVHFKTKLFKRSLGFFYEFYIHENPVIPKGKKKDIVQLDLKIFHLKDASTNIKDYEYYASLCKKAIDSGKFDCNIVCNLLDYYANNRLFNEFSELLKNTCFEVDKRSIPYLNKIIMNLKILKREKEAKELSDILQRNNSH